MRGRVKYKESFMNAKKNLLICLHGKADSGKTSTLLELGEILRRKSAIYTEIKGNAGSSDKRMVFSAFSNKIGIGTYGDGLGFVESNICELKKYKRKIFVTASREAIDRTLPYAKHPKLKSFLKTAAVWNLPKFWEEFRGGKDVVNVTGVGVLLYHIGKAIRMSKYIDKEIY